MGSEIKLQFQKAAALAAFFDATKAEFTEMFYKGLGVSVSKRLRVISQMQKHMQAFPDEWTALRKSYYESVKNLSLSEVDIEEALPVYEGYIRHADFNSAVILGQMAPEKIARFLSSLEARSEAFDLPDLKASAQAYGLKTFGLLE